ncbi:MAG TPA: ribosomal protein S18-alanine N-acetyltransferase [Nocardioides sp.]|nr:ribosomal protein S18-alanine N-acetyltransferase [Nocardioides sp.]
MSIRTATSADLAAIVASEATGFPEDPWGENLVAEGVAGLLPTIGYLVLEQDEEVVGHAVVSVAAEDAELQRIAIDPTHRGRGLGRQLLDACLADAARRGAERLILEVRETNAPALALYRAAGFTELARRERYYRDGSTAVVLSRTLEDL